MAHPDWALKYKIKGTELRHIGNNYYLYRVSSLWDKEKKRARKITHEMLGRITESGGLIPKGIKKPTKAQQILQHTASKEYGATFVLQQMSADIVKSLQTVFPNYWEKLLVLALSRLLYQAPLKNMEFLYEESFVCEQFQGLCLSKNALTRLIQELVNSKEQIVNFLRKFVDGSEHLVFDATHIISQSKGAEINQSGYNSQHNFDPQVNLFYVFSIDKQLPVYYRIFPGNVHGMSALKLCITEASLKKSIVIGDKGFCSEKNLTILQDADLQYILPLRRDSACIDYSRLSFGDYSQAFDGHFFYQDRVIFYYELPTDSNKKIVLFCDKRLRLDEETAYLKRVKQEYEGYSIDTYKAKQLCFGTMAIITNMTTCSASKIYENYKTRMEVETVFDTYKNLLQADKTYMHSNEAIEAWVFINHLATLMYYKLFNLIKTHGLLSKISPRDLLVRLARVTKLKIDNKWYLAEINTKSQKLFKSLGIAIT